MSQFKDSDSMCYVAYCKRCGGIVMGCVDEPELKDDCAKAVARHIKFGNTIGHITVSEARERFWCKCDRKPKQKTLEMEPVTN